LPVYRNGICARWRPPPGPLSCVPSSIHRTQLRLVANDSHITPARYVGVPALYISFLLPSIATLSDLFLRHLTCARCCGDAHAGIWARILHTSTLRSWHQYPTASYLIPTCSLLTTTPSSPAHPLLPHATHHYTALCATSTRRCGYTYHTGTCGRREYEHRIAATFCGKTGVTGGFSRAPPPANSGLLRRNATCSTYLYHRFRWRAFTGDGVTAT